MAQKHRFHQQRNNRSGGPSSDRRLEPPTPYEPKAPVVYGKPILVLEDAMRNTFHFKGGAWVPFEMTIAECRRTCQIKELPQKINQMTRYEVRCPV
ncbi:MAG: hypothetical protein FJ295_20070 [Planctomycetes bacterium]|nr:hypothetical protein [Planctomycetota bacterium]